MALFRPGELVDGRYEVRALVGQGGMGAVYRALDRARAVEVALKVVRPEWAKGLDLERFVREGELAARVDRLGGVARVHAAGVHAGAPYYVMELVPGRELGALLAAGALDERALAAVVEAVARTLAACHAAGVVHRDVKPSNIIVAEDGPPRLLDFGLARDLHRETRLTATGEMVGTPAYMAPEQAGGGQADARADLYALGAILHHGLAGRPPFAGPLVQLLHQKLTRDPPRPSSLREPGAVSTSLEAICLCAMARSPAARYSSADALADDLARWRRGEAPLAAARGRTALVALAAVALAVTLGGGALGWREVDRRARAAALERGLEWDGSRCLVEPRACAGGPHVLVQHALGLGVGPGPTLAEVDAQAASLEGTSQGGEGAVTRDRLEAWGRLLDRARAPAGGPTGELVEALCSLEEGRLDEVRERLAAAARSSQPAPERPLVLARVAVEALRRGPDDTAASALWPSLFEAGEALAVDAAVAPGLVDVRLAALADEAVVARWAEALDVRRGPEAVERHLQGLTALLGCGPAAPEVERAFLVRLGARVGASLTTATLDDDELQRGLLLERALRRLAPASPPWTLDELVDERIRDHQGRGNDVPTRLIVAALGAGSRMSRGLANVVDLTNLEQRLPPTSRALRFVRLAQLRDKDPALRRAAAREVLQGTDDDLGPALLACAHLALVDAVATLLEQAARTVAPEDVAEGLASAEACRRLGADFPSVSSADITAAVRAELRLRCASSGWSSAPEVVAMLERWLDERIASPGPRGPREWLWLRPKVWIGWVASLSSLEDLSSAPALVALGERLARAALDSREVGTTEAWQVRGLLVRLLRAGGRGDAAERLVREHLDPTTWSHPLFPAEAVRTLIAVDLDLAERVFADAQPLFAGRNREFTVELATRELAAALSARANAAGR